MTKSRGLRTRRVWTEDEDEVMRRFYPDMTARDLAAMMKRTERSVYARATEMGLKKSAEFLASEASGRLAKDDPRGASGRFRKGQPSWSKGTKGRVGVQEACRAAQFKSGSKPQNTQPIGSYRVNRSKGGQVLELKTSDRPGSNHLRWTPVSRVVWEREHGPVPAGHIVVFRPGTATVKLEEITPDRLECITRAEHARRNHPRNHSPELAKLVQLKGAITRQVNRINREAQERSAAE